MKAITPKHIQHKKNNIVEPLVERESEAITVLKALGFNEGEPFMVGVANYAVQLQIEGDRLLAWECSKVSSGNWEPSKQLFDGFRYLYRLSDGKDVFLFPNKLQGGMSNRHATEFNTVFFEIDPPKGSDIAQQLKANRARINAIQERGLTLSAQIYSGNKSDHNYFRLSSPVSSDVWLNLMRKVAIAFQSDPAIVTLGRKMRFPAVVRRVGGSLRRCKTKLTGAVYSPSELEQWANTLIKETYGVQPPDYVSEDRFREYKKLYLSGLDTEEVQQLLIADEYEFQQKYEDIDLSDIPTEILQPIAVRALATIPESVPGEGSYEEIYRRMAGGLKHIFGEELAIAHLHHHSPQRDASHTVRSVTAYNSASLFKVAREHGGFEWDIEDAEPLQDYFRDDVIRAYATYKGKELSLQLSTHRKRFQLLGCPDKYWKQLCNEVAVEADSDPVYGASADWWERFEQGQVGRGSYLGEGNPQDTPEWIRENQIKPWLNRLHKIGDRLFSYTLAAEERTIITPEELGAADGGLYSVLFHSEKERYQLVAEAKNRGFKIVVDKSKTGVGKTHNLLYFGDSADEILLFLPSHRNPHVKELGDVFFEMPTRHNGLWRHKDGMLRRSPEVEGQTPEIESNCIKADEFLEADRVGRNLEIDSPCSSCPFNDNCGADVQNRPAGSGFRRMRAHALKKAKIRGHLSQFSGMKEHYLQNKIAIVDEAGDQLKDFKVQEITFAEIDKKLRLIDRIHPGKSDAFKPLIDHIKELADTNITPFAVDHDSIIDTAPNPCDDDDKALLKGLLTGLSDGKGDWEYVDGIILNELAGQSTPFEPLSDLVKVWCGDRGSISVYGETVTITMPDRRYIEMLQKCGSVLLMDATPNLDLIARQFGIDPSEILVITRPIPDNSRLKITVIDTPGTKSRQSLFNSQQSQDRVNGIIQEIRDQRDERARVIGFKNCPIAHDGWWGNHSRGDNSNAGVKTLITYGLPYPNLEACRAQYRAMTGGLDGFEAYYAHLVAAEIIQVAGRQRAHRFDSEFELFMICTDLDPRFLKHLGCQVNVIHAAQINPKFGTDSQYRRFRLGQIAKEVLETGHKLTQAAIAQVSGTTQQAVQQMCKAFPGGWKAFRREIQGSLIKPTKGALYFDSNAHQLDDWQGFTPLTAVTIIAPLLQSQDFAAIKSLIEDATPSKKMWVQAIALNLFALEPEKIEIEG